MDLFTIDPYTEDKICSYNYYSEQKINSLLNQSTRSFQLWKHLNFSERGELLSRVRNLLIERKSMLALLMAREMGKPVTAGEAELEKCAFVCSYYIDNAEQLLKDEPISDFTSDAYIKFQPLGTILAVMPWNFPFWQVFRFAAPNLMAGNTIALKHAPNVTGCALEIERLFVDAGCPEGVFTTLIADIPQMENIVFHDSIRGVTLTGSLRAGSSLAGLAGRAGKKSMLELGGSDPYIILDDADLQRSVSNCVISRLFNSGQTCISAKRFFVSKKKLKEVEYLFVSEMSKFQIDNPTQAETKYGPMARFDLRDQLKEQVDASINMGAKCLIGGSIPTGKGVLYSSTVLSNVKKGMPAFDDETFGPVAAIIPVESSEEAVYLANSSQFGLGGAVFTSNIEKGKQIASELEVGICAINDYVRSDPRIPFGGIKNSGYGREVSHYGIKEFLNIKSVYIG